MVKCAVSCCVNTTYKTSKNEENVKVMFHGFPQDIELSKIWAFRCVLSNEINIKYAKVCSEHFKEEDYERDLKSELLNIDNKKKKLKKTAIPSLKLEIYKEIPTSTARTQRLYVRERKALVAQILKPCIPDEPHETQQPNVKDNIETDNCKKICYNFRKPYIPDEPHMTEQPNVNDNIETDNCDPLNFEHHSPLFKDPSFIDEAAFDSMKLLNEKLEKEVEQLKAKNMKLNAENADLRKKLAAYEKTSSKFGR